MLVLSLSLLLLIGGASAQQRRACPRTYWRGQCTVCPGYWYQTCPNGDADIGERGCGFLGCETQCRDPDGNGYDEGCGCKKGTGCLKKDCTVSAFGNWSSCSKSCGGGKQSRTRSVTQQPVYGGAACPAVREERGCNSDACPTPAPTESPTVTPTLEGLSYKEPTNGLCRNGWQRPGDYGWKKWTDAEAGKKVFYNDVNCEAYCNRDRKCTGYAVPKKTEDNKWLVNPERGLMCETYHGKDAKFAKGAEESKWYMCYMRKENAAPTTEPTTEPTYAPTNVDDDDDDDDVECPAEKYVNTSLRVKKAASTTIKLIMEKTDPMCECYAKCKAAENGTFSYWEYSMKKKKPICKCYAKGDKRVKTKEQKGATAGYLTAEGKKDIEKSKNRGRRGGRRRRRRRG